MTEFTMNDETVARARAAAEALIDAGDAAIANGVEAPTENYRMVIGSYGWWRLVNRTSKAVLLLSDSGYSAPEVAPLIRNIFNHAYALHWLVDNGEAAVDAVISAGADSHEKMLAKLEATGWDIAAEYRQVLSEQSPEPARTPEEEARHRKLLHEIRNVHDMLERYGSADLYPVYSHLSALSHTSVATASAYLARHSDGSVQIRPVATDLGSADIVQLALALIQAAHVFSPLLTGDPLRPAVDKAIADLRLEGVQLLPTRIR